MAAAYFSKSSFSSAAGHGLCLRRGRLPPSFLSRAVNGDDSSSSEKRARISLKDLDDQLASPPRPRPPPGIETEESKKPAPVKGSLPVLSDGLLLYIAGALFFITLVNNVIFHFFVERPNQNSEITREKKLDSKTSRLGKSLVAPEPQARTEM
ncbi:hypothetical protein L7F22_016875 [Adiantum nelumboides]|nr:hypothetical protein [Adiantum nelumboides]